MSTPGRVRKRPPTSCQAMRRTATHCDSSPCFEREVGLVGDSAIVDTGDWSTCGPGGHFGISPVGRRYHGSTAGYIKQPQRSLHVVLLINPPPLIAVNAHVHPQPRLPCLSLSSRETTQPNLPRWSAPGPSMSSSTTTPVTLVRVGCSSILPTVMARNAREGVPRGCGRPCLSAQITRIARIAWIARVGESLTPRSRLRPGPAHLQPPRGQEGRLELVSLSRVEATSRDTGAPADSPA
jgi:hypothetical protein